MTLPNHKIIVSGDRMPGVYRLKPHTLSKKDCESLSKSSEIDAWDFLEPDREHAFPLDGGAAVLFHMIRGMLGECEARDPVESKRSCFLSPIAGGAFVTPAVADCANTLMRVEESAKGGCKQVLLRVAEDGNVPLGGNSAAVTPQAAESSGAPPSASDIRVHWLMPLHHLEIYQARKDTPSDDVNVPTEGPECSFHIQVGLLSGNRARKSEADPEKEVGPGNLARPTEARVIVTSLDEICPHVRVRRALSYDSIVVDLLTVARGYEVDPNPTLQFKRMIGATKNDNPDVKVNYVVIRINNASALLYKWDLTNPAGTRENAWLLFHQDRPAPLIDPGKGRMFGYNTIIGAEIATTLSTHPADKTLDDALFEAVNRAIRLQFSHYASGFGGILGKSLKEGSISGETIGSLVGIEREKLKEEAKKEADSPVRRVRIDIADAVARHSLWFITKNWKPESFPKFWDAEKRFKRVAEQWLCDKQEPKKTIPTVSIKKQLLVDRREIEDYLSLRGEMIRYSDKKKTGNAKRPLNLAVFGPPGSGKSYGIKQVTADIQEFGGYDDKPLEFNLSQFTSLDDYAVAFHQVRDSCLKDKIPIVFFDEFDSSYEGVPFGWLKYFLAPMQDSEFTDKGHKYRLGPCVLVFAGGVNRSFEEFAGRSRNPAFIESKGPDFMSRLRDHINIRGINKPDGDDHFDQGRYLLRRGAILHGMLCERLRRHRDQHEVQLLKPEVARAFLEIDRFRHGIRSMEAILDMSDMRVGTTLGPSDLPPLEQLDMHVDGRAFLDLVRKEDNSSSEDDVDILVKKFSETNLANLKEDDPARKKLEEIQKDLDPKAAIISMYLEHDRLFSRLLDLIKA